MIGRAEIKFAWSSPTSGLPVIRFVSALRHTAVRQVGNLQQDVLQRSLYLIQPEFRLLQFVAQMGDLCENRAGVFALALGIANLLRRGIAARLQFLGAGLKIL